MRPAFLGLTGLLGFFVLFVAPGVGLTQSNTAELLAKSDIVFTGIVSDVAAASFAQVPASEGTLVVDVDTVHLAPPVLSIKSGDRITVALREPGSIRQGTRATFFATGWILGDGIAVREIGHRIETPTSESSDARMEMQQAQQMVSDAKLSERLRSADAVVIGRVTRVQTGSQATFLVQPMRITEHDPQWREAVIAVETGIKGATAGEEIVVRFPASIDIRWYATPKFEVGQEGTFILQRDQVSGAPFAMHAGGQVAAYTAMSEQDVLSRDDAARVRSLIAE
jgi:hypothetical protein